MQLRSTTRYLIRKPVSSQDQPSLQSKFDDCEAAAADEAHKTLFNAAKVCDVIWCQEML